MKTQNENILEKYLYDINLADKLFITLKKDKIYINADNYRQFTAGLTDFEYSKYSIVHYDIGINTVLTILEHGVNVNSQFLIKSRDILDGITIEDLTKYVRPVVANLVLDLFD
tara:strand:+ start:3872 stop:4210 length:339 start_codon:yes stop_codon:yes gene_type:complete